MEEIKILEDLFDKKTIQLLKVLFRDSEKEFYLQEISEISKVPMATTSRLLNKFERLEIIEVKQISRFKLYKIGKTSKTRYLSKLFKEDLKILEQFIEMVKEIENVRTVILHGKESKDKANILLIGEKIDPGQVKSICAELNEKYKFVISPLSLTVDQYNQMSQMGLYSGQKKILFER